MTRIYQRKDSNRYVPFYETIVTKPYLLILIYLLISLASCNVQTDKNIYNPKAIELNNKALEFNKTQNYDSTLFYLDKSIKIDTTYYLAYGNKAVVYCALKDFKNALIATEKEIEIKPDLAEGWTFAGILNDKLGDSLNAKKYYKKSIEIFDKRIANQNKQKYLKADKLNRALSLILIGQEDEGQNEIKKLKEKYPSDKSLDDFLDLNKQEYLKQIFNEK